MKASVVNDNTTINISRKISQNCTTTQFFADLLYAAPPKIAAHSSRHLFSRSNEREQRKSFERSSEKADVRWENDSHSLILSLPRRLISDRWAL